MDLKDKKIVGLELYKSGMSLTEISKKLKISRKTITKYVKESGIKIEKNVHKYFINSSYFKVIDSEAKAYFLGLFMADGCVIKRKSYVFEVTLKSEDAYILEAFLQDAKGTYSIKDKVVKYKNNNVIYKRLIISDSEFCRNLIKQGVVPNKSLIANPPFLDDKYKRHFIRGLLDGDGHYSKSRRRITLTTTYNLLKYVLQAFNADISLIHLKNNIAYFDISKNYYLIIIYLYFNAHYYINRKRESIFAVLHRYGKDM
jgi:biotin operon repressor